MMLVWRVIAAALAVVLAGVVLIDMAAVQQRSQPPLLHQKGLYIGPQDSGLDDATRTRLRARGLIAGAG